MKCKYAAWLADNGAADKRGLTAAAISRDIGIGATTIKEHRRNECCCGKVETVKVAKAEAEPTEALTGKMDLGPDGGEFLDVQTTEQVTDWTHIFQRFNLDPAEFTIVGDTVRCSTWQQSKRTADGDRDVVNLYSYRAQFKRRVDEDQIDLPALYAAAKSVEPARHSGAESSRATVIVWSDPQIGKTGSRGGTPELLERSAQIRAKLDSLLSERRPGHILIADAGDGIEGFESGGNPMFTNDLSLAGQLDLYGTELFEYIRTAEHHAPVTVAAVPSNHAAWRQGKQQLGKPGDDLGLFMHRQVQKVAGAAGMSVYWEWPDEYDESVSVDLIGTSIGLVHGNQFAPGKAVDWWQGQAFGAQAVSGADVMVHGHYHSFSANVAGRNPANMRQRWCLGAPTLDNGSDWYRNIKGRDSDPGLLVFDVTSDGFDLGSVTILSA